MPIHRTEDFPGTIFETFFFLDIFNDRAPASLSYDDANQQWPNKRTRSQNSTSLTHPAVE